VAVKYILFLLNIHVRALTRTYTPIHCKKKLNSDPPENGGLQQYPKALTKQQSTAEHKTENKLHYK
jgi:hypothetical protein